MTTSQGYLVRPCLQIWRRRNEIKRWLLPCCPAQLHNCRSPLESPFPSVSIYHCSSPREGGRIQQHLTLNIQLLLHKWKSDLISIPRQSFEKQGGLLMLHYISSPFAFQILLSPSHTISLCPIFSPSLGLCHLTKEVFPDSFRQFLCVEGVLACMCTSCVPTKVRKEHQIPQNWSHQ